MTNSKRNRILLSILILNFALLVGGTLLYRYFGFARPVGSGPVPVSYDKEPFGKTWTEQPVVLLALGDNLFAGAGVKRSENCLELLANPDGEDPSLKQVLPSLQIENLAVSESTSFDLVKLSDRLEQRSPDVLGIVLVSLGGVELWRNFGNTEPEDGAAYGASIAQASTWSTAFGDRLALVLTNIQASFPGGCHIFLAEIPDCTDGVGDLESLALNPWDDSLQVWSAYNNAIRDLTRDSQTVHLLPLHRTFLGHGIHCTQFWRDFYRPEDPRFWFQENMRDPNVRGHDAVRKLILDSLAKVHGRI